MLVYNAVGKNSIIDISSEKHTSKSFEHTCTIYAVT